MTFPSRLVPAAVALLLIVSCMSSASALQPVEIVTAPPMEPGYPHCGAVTGRVTTENTSNGLGGAYVAIVNAADFSQAYYEGQADENGYYQFQAVNNTVTGGSVSLSYRVYASLAGAGEGISDPLGVEDSATATVNVAIANGGRTSSGFAVQHVPMPDDVRLSAQPDTLFAGGNVSVITAQLYLNGQPYERSGVTITFFTDNDTRGYLPAEKKVITDSSGRASINLTAGNITGNLSVTGNTNIGISRNLTGTCTVQVLRPASEENAVSSPGVQNASGLLPVDQTCGNSPPGNLSANTTLSSASATPAPAPSTLSAGVYVLLAILLAAVAGFALYVLAFRKK